MFFNKFFPLVSPFRAKGYLKFQVFSCPKGKSLGNKIKGGKKMGKRMKMKKKDGLAERNKHTVKLALRELNEPQTRLNIETGYNACCKALGASRKWTRKEVINCLKKYWYEDIDDFLEGLTIEEKFRR